MNPGSMEVLRHPKVNHSFFRTNAKKLSSVSPGGDPNTGALERHLRSPGPIGEWAFTVSFKNKSKTRKTHFGSSDHPLTKSNPPRGEVPAPFSQLSGGRFVDVSCLLCLILPLETESPGLDVALSSGTVDERWTVRLSRKTTGLVIASSH
jgi:hypothetical protein